MNLNWRKCSFLVSIMLSTIFVFVACEGSSENDHVAGISPSEVMIEVEGMPILWEEIYYDMASFLAGAENPNELFEGNPYGESMTYNEFALRRAKDNALTRRTVMTLFNEFDGEVADWEVDEDETYLRSLHMTANLQKLLVEQEDMLEQLPGLVYGENGERLPEGSVAEFAELESIIRVKYILIGTENRTEAEAFALATEVYEELQTLTGEGQFERFETLRMEVGSFSDSDSAEGYTFTSGMMEVAPFETARALNFDEISSPVQGEQGYYIVLRLPIVAEHNLYTQGESPIPLWEAVARGRIVERLDEIRQNLVYTETSVFGQIDFDRVLSAIEETRAEENE